MRLAFRYFGTVALLLLAPHRLSAQGWRGVVRDSLSRRPIPGVVVLLFDSGSTVLARTLTDERGEYRVAGAEAARRLEVMKLGFRPARVALPLSSGEGVRVDVLMGMLSSLLEPVRVVANAHCPRRRDEAATFALLEQARAGLQAIVVARGANPPEMIRLGFQRRMDGTSDRIIRQIVRGDTSRSATSFDAVRTATEFGRRGFIAESSSVQSYLAPDADVLLDPRFAEAYCFRIASADRKRPTQIGLAFAPAQRVKGRVDVNGTLWVDTLARALVEVEFQYRGFVPRVEALSPGGRVSFMTAPNGVTLIDQWVIRMVGAEFEPMNFPGTPGTVREKLVVSEGGGEVAHARWTDGQTWNGRLGTLRVRAVLHSGQAAVGTVVRLWDTHYKATADSSGEIVIPDLIPGPYELVVLDPKAAPLGLQLSTPVRFVATRDSTIDRRLDVPTADDTTVKLCLRDHRLTVGDSVRILGRVMTKRGEPIDGIDVSLDDDESTIRHGAPLESRRTEGDGLFAFCHPRLAIGLPITVSARDRNQRLVARVTGRLSEQLTIIPLIVDTDTAGVKPR